MERDILNKGNRPQQMMKEYQLTWALVFQRSRVNKSLVFFCRCYCSWFHLYFVVAVVVFVTVFVTLLLLMVMVIMMLLLLLMMMMMMMMVMVMVMTMMSLQLWLWLSSSSMWILMTDMVLLQAFPLLPPRQSEGVPMSTNSCCCMCGTPTGAHKILWKTGDNLYN